MSQSAEPMVIRLRLSPLRYWTVAAICGALALFAAFLSVQPTLVNPNSDAKAQAMRRALMSIDRVAGVWPLPAAGAIGFLALSLFLVWALAARRPFELAMDACGVSWPSLAPWRRPAALSWSEITSVAINQAGDHLVFNTTQGRRTIPAWWLPSGTLPGDVVRTATALRTQAMRA